MKEQLKDVTPRLHHLWSMVLILFKKHDRNLLELFKVENVKIFLRGSFQGLCKIHNEGYMGKFHCSQHENVGTRFWSWGRLSRWKGMGR